MTWLALVASIKEVSESQQTEDLTIHVTAGCADRTIPAHKAFTRRPHNQTNSGTLGTMELLIIAWSASDATRDARTLTPASPPTACEMKYWHCWRHWLVIKKKKKKWSSLPHQHYIKAKLRRGCWLQSISSDFLHNEHVIASWFQLEQDTDLDSCMLKCLHLRIPHRYQMWRRLRQTWLVLWQTAAGHGLEPTSESICCAYHLKESRDLAIWKFRWDKRRRG